MDSVLTRECNFCGDVERCSHFDGRWLSLAANTDHSLYRVCTGNESDTRIGYAVGGDGLRPSRYYDQLILDTRSYDAALAAFHEAEERLLWGDL